MQTAETRCVSRRSLLKCEELEDRSVPATVSLTDGTLTITGTGSDRIRVYTDGTTIHVLDGTVEIGAFAPSAVTAIQVNTPGGKSSAIIDPNLTQPTTFTDTGGNNKFAAGGGPATFSGGSGNDTYFGSQNTNVFNGGSGANNYFNVKTTDATTLNPNDRVLASLSADPSLTAPQETLTASEVGTLLQRAAAASASTDAIIVVTDRNGQILGVRVESGVDPNITGNLSNLVFAVDGAYAEALTGAYFGNNQAPLTSRTIQFISQSTVTQREVESNPNISDPNSTVAGPGFVAPVGTGGHFPPNIPNTPQVDLFDIEHTNRDSTLVTLANGTQVTLPNRFNINSAFVPNGQTLFTPNDYGFQSGLMLDGKSRGIGTLPGGIPIYKNGQVVGGIGVFFPGKTGYATEENSSLSATFDPTKPDRSLEAEWMAFAAVGGTRTAIGSVPLIPVDTIGGIALPAGFGLPAGRIDLVGIQLDVFGRGGSVEGGLELERESALVGRGNPNDGTNLQVGPGTGGGAPVFLRGGNTVPTGWLVTPHDGDGITAQQVTNIITAGLVQAAKTRAAIRLPVGSRASFVFAVADKDGNIVGLYRMPDATIFSIDVAVAKARNVAYYANPAELQPIDMVPGLPDGTAITNRTVRYLAEPHYPEGINSALPGPFSILNDPGINITNGLNIGAPLPASTYFNTVAGNDAFNPNSNFHSPFNPLNQNGIVFFPGSSPLYNQIGNSFALAGGLGVSGDGVDQDDVATVAAQSGYGAPLNIRSDNFLVNGVSPPYQKFNRNPEG